MSRNLFSGHQNAENEQNKALNKQVQNWRFLLNLDYALLHICYNHLGQLRHLRLYTSHPDNKLKTS